MEVGEQCLCVKASENYFTQNNFWSIYTIGVNVWEFGIKEEQDQSPSVSLVGKVGSISRWHPQSKSRSMSSPCPGPTYLFYTENIQIRLQSYSLQWNKYRWVPSSYYCARTRCSGGRRPEILEILEEENNFTFSDTGSKWSKFFGIKFPGVTNSNWISTIQPSIPNITWCTCLKIKVLHLIQFTARWTVLKVVRVENSAILSTLVQCDDNITIIVPSEPELATRDPNHWPLLISLGFVFLLVLVPDNQQCQLSRAGWWHIIISDNYRWCQMEWSGSLQVAGRNTCTQLLRGERRVVGRPPPGLRSVT